MNARLYSRVSTEEQAEEGYSISAQVRACRQFCRSQGWEIAGEYIDDGYSAKDTDRPALKRLLGDVESGDVVVVWRLDRLTRSVLDLHTLLQTFERKGATFRSVTEPYDTTTAIGRLFVTLVAALAQWERENLGERVLQGMSEMVRQGRWHGGPRPFGYIPRDQRLEVEPAEARIVRDLFERYVRGEGTRALAWDLNRRGIKTTRGALWNSFTVSYILRNPVYTGRIAFRKVKPIGTRKVRTPEQVVLSERVHDPIVDDELFARVQALMKHRAEGKVRTIGHIYPLTGVLYCGKCGGRMNGWSFLRESGLRRHYYVCQNRKRLGTCDMRMMPQEALEAEFVRRLDAIASREALAASMDSATGDEDEARLEALLQELRTLSQRKARWYDAFEAGAIGVDDLRERTAAIVLREAEIQREIEALSADRPEIDVDEYLEALQSLPSIWAELEPQERKVWVHEYFRRIVVHEDGSLDIEV